MADQVNENDALYFELKNKALEGYGHDLWSLALHVLYRQPEKSKAIEAANLIESFDVDKAPEVKFQMAQLFLLTDERAVGFAILEELMDANYPPAYCTIAVELMYGSTEYTAKPAIELLREAKGMGSMRARYILSIYKHQNAPFFLKPMTYIFRVYWTHHFNKYWENTDAAESEYL